MQRHSSDRKSLSSIQLPLKRDEGSMVRMRLWIVTGCITDFAAMLQGRQATLAHTNAPGERAAAPMPHAGYHRGEAPDPQRGNAHEAGRQHSQEAGRRGSGVIPGEAGDLWQREPATMTLSAADHPGRPLAPAAPSIPPPRRRPRAATL